MGAFARALLEKLPVIWATTVCATLPLDHRRPCILTTSISIASCVSTAPASLPPRMRRRRSSPLTSQHPTPSASTIVTVKLSPPSSVRYGYGKELCNFPDGADKGLSESVFPSKPLYLLRSLPGGALLW